ncbi:transcriptional regulator [Pantoea wallisii]|uniref:Transcriptional regulator n=1 Tax=Pantoea wallisii TaxID=1076551 RepID=A0A1X1DDY0_9GAMM|nr:LacI family DNA-binding transcriptional regulator [Pantoea wallisii]ORM74711.1 transcriptional regulator [Pantoea wallisii]
MKKLTLIKVAELAGVGIATVDRVLNERGGVRPETVRKVLRAARQAGLQRLLPDDTQHPWRIEVFLSNNGTWFFQQLADEFAHIADRLGYRKIKLFRTLVAENPPDKLAEKIKKSSELRDGIIVYGHDYPLIHDALKHCREKGIPVVTLVSDLAEASRFCHVGINQYQAGRTAGLLMSQSMAAPGDVIMVSGRFDFRAHIDRISGFRDAITQRAPWLNLREVLAGEDEQHKIRSLLNRTLQQAQNVVGLYNSGDNNRDISALLQQHKLSGRCCYITHELYDVTRQLLQDGSLSYTLDQNARQHAVLATDLLIRHLEHGYQPDIYQDGRVELRIVTAENID